MRSGPTVSHICPLGLQRVVLFEGGVQMVGLPGGNMSPGAGLEKKKPFYFQFAISAS